jgi:hypothetical protein
MSEARHRTETPVALDLESADLKPIADPPARDPPPLRLPPPLPFPAAALRARRSTLVSPIPALLAAKMKIRQTLDGAGNARDATPLPIDGRNDVTARQGAEDRASILRQGDADYLVEVDPVKTQP